MHQIAIYSTDRSPKPNYCAATIESMVERSNGAVSRANITVFVSGSSSDYLSDQGVAVVDRDLDEDQSARSSVHNASFNMRRAILGARPDAALFLCEDDIAMAYEWFRRVESLSTVVSQIQPHAGLDARTSPEESEFGLALFFPYGAGPTPSDWSDAFSEGAGGALDPLAELDPLDPLAKLNRGIVRPARRVPKKVSADGSAGGWWQPYAPERYWGNQCLRLSPAALRHLQAWLSDQPDASLDRPPDLVLKQFFSEAGGVGLFGCVPSLAQHVGLISVAVPSRGGKDVRESHRYALASVWGASGVAEKRGPMEIPYACNFDAPVEDK
jgi:hypothetical protein